MVKGEVKCRNLVKSLVKEGRLLVDTTMNMGEDPLMELSAQSTALGGAVFATQLTLGQFKPPNTRHQCNGRQWFLVDKWETCYLGVEYWDYSWLRVKDEFQDN